MFNTHYYHEVYKTKSNKFYLLDVCDTFDCGAESAYSPFDAENFYKTYCDYFDCSEYTQEDIEEYGEEFDSFRNWEIFESHKSGRSVNAMIKRLKKYVDAL